MHNSSQESAVQYIRKERAIALNFLEDAQKHWQK